MDLPSQISFRTSQPDPASLLAGPARASGGGQDFQRHLDNAGSSSERAVQRRDGQRQQARADGSGNSRDDAAAPARDSAGEAAGTQTSEQNADASMLPAAADVMGGQSIAADAGTGDEAETASGSQPGTADETLLTAGAPDAADADAAALPEKTAAATPGAAGQPVMDESKDKTDAQDEAAMQALLALNQPAPLPHPPARAAAVAETGGVMPDGKAAAPAGTAPAPASAMPDDMPDDMPGGMQDKTPQMTDDGGDDPQAGSGSRSGQGLGHEAAAGMAARKQDARDAAASPQTQIQTQAQTQAAQHAASAPAALAARLAPSGADTTAASAISSAAASSASGDGQGLTSSQAQNTGAATVRIGTLPGQSQPTQLPAMAIALQIARNVQKGLSRFNIQLDPPEMGRIDVRMEVQRDGQVAAHLVVEKPQTLDLLQRDARALQQALNDAGLQADSDSLSFSLRDENAGGNARGFSGGEAGSNAPSAAQADAGETVQSLIYNVNLSATGGVDIRV